MKPSNKSKTQVKPSDQESTPKVHHLLVDLDGTLLGARNIPLTMDFMFRTLRALRKYGGVRKAFRAIRALNQELSRTAEAGKAVLLTNDQRAVAIFSQVLDLSMTEGEKILQSSMAMVFPSLKRHFYPIQEARDFLEWAKDHYTLTLATNPVWPEEIVKLRLEWAGIDPKMFRTITHAAIMHAVKPTNEYYREVLAAEKLAPTDCILIGNEYEMDLPATQVGIPVFIVTQDAPKKSTRAKPIRRPKGSAQAWEGSFKALRTLLESA